MSDKKQPPQRFYVVTDKTDGASCLVAAVTKSGALRRSAEHYCNVRVASSEDIVKLMRNGCDVIEDTPGTEQDLQFGESSGKPAVHASEQDLL